MAPARPPKCDRREKTMTAPVLAHGAGSMGRFWSRRSGTFKGSVCLAAAGAAFVVIAAIVRWLSASMPLFQIAFLQQATVVLLIAPALLAGGWRRMATARPRWHVLRSAATAAAILFGFLAAKHLPVAEVTALLFSRMAFTAMLAALVLGEAVRRETWVGVVLATVGVLLVLSPEAARVNVYAWSAVASALAISITMLLTRYMRAEQKDAIVGWQAVGLTVLFAAPGLADWAPLDAAHWLGCAAIGVLLWISQHLNVLAYRYGEAGAIQPAEASRLLVAVGIDVAFFDLFPSLSSLAGGVFVILAICTSVGAMRGLFRGPRDAEPGD